MLDTTEEQKKAFYMPGYSNRYEITFNEIDLVIVNEQLHTEEVTIRESICDEEDFTLGGCIASSIEFTVSEIIAEQISGLEFTVKLNASDEDGVTVLSIPMGTYRVDSAQRVDDKDYKKITAYDRMYDASVDVSDWYNGLFPVIGTEKVPSTDEEGNETTVTKNVYGTTTAKAMRESLLKYLGIPFVVQTAPNDGMTVSKTIEPSKGSLPGTTVLKALCTVNGGFGRMNREGEFEVISVKGLAVFPEDAKGEAGNLYPSETLYPEDAYEYLGISDEENQYPEYRSVTYEEYMTQPITCLNIQTDEEDTGTSIGGDASNPYQITANFLLYGKSSNELETIGGNIFKQIEGLTYRPNTTELNGLPYLECGDVFVLEKRTDVVESYILSRTLSGIQALIDTYEARGNEVRANEVSVSEEIQQLKGKLLKIIKQSDRFAVSLVDLEKDAEALLDMSATNILLQVTKDGKVAAMTLDASGEATSFTIEADNINFNGKTFNLTSDKMSIESANFSIDENGAVSARAIDISGGSINLVTAYDGESLIHLQNVVYDESGESGFRGTIDYFGHGYPTDIEASSGENYLDLDSGTVYRCSIRGTSRSWYTYGDPIPPSSVRWTDIIMNTEDGFSASEYYYERYDVEEDGDLVETDFKENTSYSVSGQGIRFEKLMHDYVRGEAREHDLEANMQIRARRNDDDPQSQEEPYPVIEVDVPLYPTNIKSGYVVKDIPSTNMRFTVDVELDMPSRPNVTATAETTNPAAVSVSVADVTESGFTIYIHRTDATGRTRVNWIAMC